MVLCFSWDLDVAKADRWWEYFCLDPSFSFRSLIMRASNFRSNAHGKPLHELWLVTVKLEPSHLLNFYCLHNCHRSQQPGILIDHGHRRAYPSGIEISTTIASRRDQWCPQWYLAFLRLLHGETQLTTHSIDVRNIVSDDDTLQTGILPALKEYNLSQFITADVPGHQHQVSVSTYMLLADDWIPQDHY